MTTYFLVLLLTTNLLKGSTYPGGTVAIPQESLKECQAQVERYKPYSNRAFCVKGYVR